jgi:phytanoyl-CoA hydroxylase
MGKLISDAQWKQYDEQGYIKLGKLLNDHDLNALCQRIDDIMLGKASLDYNKILMQLDSETGQYGDAGEQSKGHKGSTLGYRKIQDLELDPLFLEYMERPIFKEICDRIYGPTTPLAAFRAMFMNKPARKGTSPLAPGPLDLARSRSGHHAVDGARSGNDRQWVRAGHPCQP